MEFFLLRDRLRQAGFEPETFRYHSMHTTLAGAADALAARLRAIGGKVHVVAHSLGGLIACAAFGAYEDLPAGRVVLMGSPVRGSRAARALAELWLGRAMLGPLALAELARERDFAWSVPREIGVIAGSRSVGLGRALTDLPRPNDGTVCVDETRIPGATAKLVLDVSHTGMLYSSEVAKAVTRFLELGRFQADPAR